MNLTLGFALLSMSLFGQTPVRPATPELAAMKQQAHDLTHALVCKDSTYSQSIQEILPNGVKRLPEADLAKKTLKAADPAAGEVAARSFVVGQTRPKDLKTLLGQPVREAKGRKGDPIWSFDAVDGSIIVFVFDAKNLLATTFAYSTSPL